jgi:hypothetical protein
MKEFIQRRFAIMPTNLKFSFTYSYFYLFIVNYKLNLFKNVDFTGVNFFTAVNKGAK